MRSTSFIAAALCAFASTAYSAPTPQLSNIIGSITNPGAGNNNKFEGIANGNGNGNGNGNEAGNNNGNDNSAGNNNEAGSGNKVTFPSLSGLKEREAGVLDGITNTLGSITNPTAGSGNSFKDIANGNGNGNGNGNSAGNGNGNGNSAGNGNQAGSGNTVTVSPDTALPSVELPDINFSPTINLRRRLAAVRQ